MQRTSKEGDLAGNMEMRLESIKRQQKSLSLETQELISRIFNKLIHCKQKRDDLARGAGENEADDDDDHMEIYQEITSLYFTWKYLLSTFQVLFSEQLHDFSKYLYHCKIVFKYRPYFNTETTPAMQPSQYDLKILERRRVEMEKQVHEKYAIENVVEYLKEALNAMKNMGSTCSTSTAGGVGDHADDDDDGLRVFMKNIVELKSRLMMMEENMEGVVVIEDLSKTTSDLIVKDDVDCVDIKGDDQLEDEADRKEIASTDDQVLSMASNIDRLHEERLMGMSKTTSDLIVKDDVDSTDINGDELEDEADRKELASSDEQVLPRASNIDRLHEERLMGMSKTTSDLIVKDDVDCVDINGDELEDEADRKELASTDDQVLPMDSNIDRLHEERLMGMSKTTSDLIVKDDVDSTDINRDELEDEADRKEIASTDDQVLPMASNIDRLMEERLMGMSKTTSDLIVKDDVDCVDINGDELEDEADRKELASTDDQVLPMDSNIDRLHEERIEKEASQKKRYDQLLSRRQKRYLAMEIQKFRTIMINKPKCRGDMGSHDHHVEVVQKKTAKVDARQKKRLQLVEQNQKSYEEALKLSEYQKIKLKNLQGRMMGLKWQLEDRILEVKKLKRSLNSMTKKSKGSGSDVENLKFKKKIEELSKSLEEKEGEVGDLEDLNRILIVKDRINNDELQEIRKELFNALGEVSSSAGRRATLIGVKRMGELDSTPFQVACKRKYGGGESTDLKAIELCTLWDERLRDANWHPFKLIQDGNINKVIIDEEDEKLKSLRNEFSDEVYKAVTTALWELNEYNSSGRYETPEMWNFKEGRKATLKEVASFILNKWKSLVKRMRQ